MEDLSAVASDAVQNLRQSLDHAACACVRASGKMDNDTYFPLVAAHGDIDDAIRKRARKLPPTIKVLIKTLAPPGGPLYELHKLGIIDKHRLLCQVGTIGGSQMRHIQAGPSWISTGPSEWDPVRNEVRYALSGTPFEMNYDFVHAINVRIEGDGLFATKPAAVALGHLAKVCDDVIGKMAREMSRLSA